jgi:hypothetical protein
VPTVTVWEGTDRTLPTDWFTTDNWTEGVPNATTDAEFLGGTSKNICAITHAAEAHSLTIDSDYDGKITIGGSNGHLKIDSGGSMANGAIVEVSTYTPLTELAGGTFTWTGGSINPYGLPGSQLGSLQVDSGATFSIQPANGNKLQFGDTLYNNGTTILDGSTAASGFTIGNGGSVVNNGTFNLEYGILGAGSDPTVSGAYIQNNGTFERTVYTNEAKVELPLENFSGATLAVNTGTLTFSGQFGNGGTPPAVSVYQAGGTTEVYNGTILNVPHGYTQDDGSLWTIGAGDAKINQGDVHLNGGSLAIAQVGGLAIGSLYMDHTLYIDGTTTVYIWLNMGTHATDYIQADAGINIGQGTQTNNSRVVFTIFNGEADNQDHTYIHTTNGRLVGAWKTVSYGGTYTNLYENDGFNNIGYIFNPSS